MGGFLDFLDNPNLLSQLIGGVTANDPMASPPPLPPNGGMGSPPADQALREAPAPGIELPMPPPRPGSTQGIEAAGAGFTPDYATPPGPPPPMSVAGPGFGNENITPQPGGQPQQPAPPQTVAMPMPPPRPQIDLPPGAQPTVGTAPPGPPLNILPPGGNPPPPPMSIAPPGGGGRPPLPPNAAPGGAPMAANSGGGMAGAFGLDPDRVAATMRRDGVRAALGGLGKGLSAVGSAPIGAPKGMQIARGLGGSLEGTADNQQKQQDKRFDQTSTAFKDMLAAKNSDDNAGYKAAQSKYLIARAQSLSAMTAAGGKGTNAWQNTPLGQVAVVEQRVAAYDGPRRKSIDAQVRSGAMDPEAAKKQYETLDKQVDEFRQNMYKGAGLDPKRAEKLRTAGEAKDNPIDTKGMSLEQFHSQVPMGGWFRDQNGVARQRTVPPPGSAEAPQAGNTGNTAAAAPNYDDRSAMSETAA